MKSDHKTFQKVFQEAERGFEKCGLIVMSVKKSNTARADFLRNHSQYFAERLNLQCLFQISVSRPREQCIEGAANLLGRDLPIIPEYNRYQTRLFSGRTQFGLQESSYLDALNIC